MKFKQNRCAIALTGYGMANFVMSRDLVEHVRFF